MNNKVLRCLMAAALGTALAVASPALAFRGGGGGGMGGGGMHAGGMGGGMGGGMHAGGMAGAHFGGMSGGARFSGMGGGPHFSGSRFTGSHFAHPGFSNRFASRAAFVHHRPFFRHHRFNRFAFIGAPLAFAAYDSCYRRMWTPYGLRWVDVCGDYAYGY
jgi:hypothetical protein